MPSPFPGMDPYIESPAYWRGFHEALVTFIAAALNTDLPPGFAANAEQRVYLMPEDRTAVPDVVVQRRAKRPAGGAGPALLDVAEPDGTISAYPEEQREAFVEIRSTIDWAQVITVIEVLSPANKTPGSTGRDEYLRKQAAVLDSETHLMEIDLLRQGLHTVAAPLPLLEQRGKWDSVVTVHRATRRHSFEYWMGSLRRPLPLVRVPLTETAPDVVLDLQGCFHKAYDAGPYARSVDYSVPPFVPLTGDEAAWAEGLLDPAR